jgi:hypothetical protein
MFVHMNLFEYDRELKEAPYRITFPRYKRWFSLGVAKLGTPGIYYCSIYLQQNNGTGYPFPL